MALKSSIKSLFPALKPSSVSSLTKKTDGIDSVLIETEEQLQLVKQWLGYDCTLKLIFRGSKNGFTGPKFHFLCDNKGPTLSVFKSDKGYIFGGFTSLKIHNPPNINPTFEKDPEAFLFNLAPHKTKHEKLPDVEKTIGRGK